MAQITIHNPDGSTTVVEEELEVYVPEITFRPIEPVPFWLAAWSMLGLKKSDVLNSITDPDLRYEAELNIEGRKHYLRDDPLVEQLGTLLGYPPEQLDALWLYVQDSYT